MDKGIFFPSPLGEGVCWNVGSRDEVFPSLFRWACPCLRQAGDYWRGEGVRWICAEARMRFSSLSLGRGIEGEGLPKRPLQKLRHSLRPRLRVVLPVFHLVIVNIVIRPIAFLGELGYQIQCIVNGIDHAISISI